MKFFKHKETGAVTPTNNARLIDQLKADKRFEAVDGSAKPAAKKSFSPVAPATEGQAEGK